MTEKDQKECREAHYAWYCKQAESNEEVPSSQESFAAGWSARGEYEAARATPAQPDKAEVVELDTTQPRHHTYDQVHQRALKKAKQAWKDAKESTGWDEITLLSVACETYQREYDAARPEAAHIAKALIGFLTPYVSAQPSKRDDSGLVEACETFRDAVLHQRFQLEEPCLDNDQTNSVLGLFDDTIGEAISKAAQGKAGA